MVAARATLSECLKRMAAALAEHPLGRRRAGANKQCHRLTSHCPSATLHASDRQSRRSRRYGSSARADCACDPPMHSRRQQQARERRRRHPHRSTSEAAALRLRSVERRSLRCARTRTLARGHSLQALLHSLVEAAQRARSQAQALDVLRVRPHLQRHFITVWMRDRSVAACRRHGIAGSPEKGEPFG